MNSSGSTTWHQLSASPWKAPRCWIGLLLITLFWPLNWALPGLRTAYLFFPLWLGYILVVDAWVEHRTGSSLWSRSRADFVWLFLASAPAWWLFELINHRTQNWEYLGGDQFSDLEYFILATISFSTVMPAVFGTAELIRSFRWMDRLKAGPRLAASPCNGRICFGLGLGMLTLSLLWPNYAYPFVWLSVFFILEPVNVWLGRQNLLASLASGDWRPVLSLSLGALVCGFFWELWNFYSYPKWIYHTPGVEFLHVFEMPLLGYGGYIPFAWELFAIRSFVWPNAPRLRI